MLRWLSGLSIFWDKIFSPEMKKKIDLLQRALHVCNSPSHIFKGFVLRGNRKGFFIV